LGNNDSVPTNTAGESQDKTSDDAKPTEQTAPAATGEESVEKGEEEGAGGVFALISKVLIGIFVIAMVILVACVYNYRYQMRKYKIAPFTPPSFLPEFLFPRNTGTSSYLVSGYTELQVGNYQAAPRFAEI